jgi:hypothetical protein
MVGGIMPESRGFHQKRLSIKEPTVRAKFLRVLAETGMVKFACDSCGVVYQQVRRQIREDPEFAEEVEEANEQYKDTLEMEAHRRAVDGWNEPVYSQKLGVKIGTIRKFSDKLLELKLKRHVPEYRERKFEDQNVVAGVMVVGLVQNSPQAWVEQFKDAEVKSLTFEGTAKEIDDED